MITRTTKYIASDGTEHDSPQAAATVSLAQTILYIADTFEMANERMAEKLALSPEALRDAVNAYFEDLEEHPDVEVDDDTTRGFEIDIATGSRQSFEIKADGTTWRADLPVDHPNYCRPFGTREG